MMRFLLTNNLFATLSCTLFALRLSMCGANTAGSWQTVFLEDFEHVGSTNIGPHFTLPATGDDATKHAWTGAYSGTRVIKLRDGSGPESTLESRLIDVSLYNRIEFSFFYRGDGMEDDDLFTVVRRGRRMRAFVSFVRAGLTIAPALYSLGVPIQRRRALVSRR